MRALFDLHRVGGVLLGAWVLVVSVGTGGILAWRPATEWANRMAGQPRIEPPSAPASAKRPPASLDAIVAAAEAALPGGTIGSIQIPAKATDGRDTRRESASCR